ncbi:unnamed protein product [Alopecurus aequalis]
MEEAGGLDLVVFPWLAFGHMIPYLELSKRLAARGHAVAFVSTPRNLARLPPVPACLSPRLRFVPLQLPRVDGLPEGAESTADLPPGGNHELLKKAMDGLAAPFAQFLAAAPKRPDWIIHDFCHHWVPPIADQHNVPCAAFLISFAAFQAFLGPRWANAAHPRTSIEDFTVTPGWIPPPSTVAYRRRSEAEWMAGVFRTNESGVSDAQRQWGMLERCRLSIYRSCDEVEPGMFALLTDLLGKPAVPAGILLPPAPVVDAAAADEVMRWLDEQPPKSVIYVALGSEAPVTLNNLHELALGLELAGVRFLWALRKPAGLFDADAGAGCNVLPDGFTNRMQGRGMVQMGWVPQVVVMAHAATGAFLTHCGWGSIVESFAFGLPLVMLPFVVCQPLVARAMEEKGIGVEVARDDTDGSFDKDGVTAAVLRVMVGDQGKLLASNARKLQEVLVDQAAQERYMDDLVEHLSRC